MSTTTTNTFLSPIVNPPKQGEIPKEAPYYMPTTALPTCAPEQIYVQENVSLEAIKNLGKDVLAKTGPLIFMTNPLGEPLVTSDEVCNLEQEACLNTLWPNASAWKDTTGRLWYKTAQGVMTPWTCHEKMLNFQEYKRFCNPRSYKSKSKKAKDKAKTNKSSNYITPPPYPATTCPNCP